MDWGQCFVHHPDKVEVNKNTRKNKSCDNQTKDKKENDGGGGKGEGSEKHLLHTTPWDFWNAFSSLVKGGVSYIWLMPDVTCLILKSVISWHTVTLAKGLLSMTVRCFFFSAFHSNITVFRKLFCLSEFMDYWIVSLSEKTTEFVLTKKQMLITDTLLYRTNTKVHHKVTVGFSSVFAIIDGQGIFSPFPEIFHAQKQQANCFYELFILNYLEF